MINGHGYGYGHREKTALKIETAEQVKCVVNSTMDTDYDVLRLSVEPAPK